MLNGSYRFKLQMVLFDIKLIESKIYQTSLTILITGLLFLTACDYVKNPVQNSATPGPDTGTVIKRKVLVEDYMGHQCGQCPKKARYLHHVLKDSIYHEKLIALTVHAGFFAITTTSGAHPYPTKLTTADGDSYAVDFGFEPSGPGYPAFMVNRVSNPSGGYCYSDASSLSGPISAIVGEAADFKIDLSGISYDANNNKINGLVKIKALKSFSEGSYKMVVLLSEDSIIAEQKDDELGTPPAYYVPNFIHRDVFRGTIPVNGAATSAAYGTAVFTGTSIALNQKDSLKIQGFNLVTTNYQPALNPAHCTVIAYIYNADVNSPKYYEIYQAEEKKLK